MSTADAAMGNEESIEVALVRAAVRVAQNRAWEGDASVESMETALKTAAGLARGTEGYTAALDREVSSVLEQLERERTRTMLRFFERRGEHDARPL